MIIIRTINLYILLFAVSAHSTLFCGIQECLKEVKGKPLEKFCDFLDFIYVINLDERPEKFAKVEEQLESIGIRPYRFSAVNGWKLPIEKLQSFGIEYKSGWRTDIVGTYFTYHEKRGIKSYHKKIAEPGLYLSHCLNRGAIGIVLSHLSVIKDAYDSNYERVWIMEDDILVKEPLDQLRQLIKEADEIMSDGWDVLYTDLDTYEGAFMKRVPCYSISPRPDINIEDSMVQKLVARTTLSDNLIKLGNRYGAYSYIINRNGMKKVLDHFYKFGMFLPYDMEFIYIPNFVQLASTKDIVTTIIGAPSDNGHPGYVYSQK